MRAKQPQRKAAAREITIRWRAENPAGYAAHIALNNALRDGKITRPEACVCGSAENLHAHHADYSRPLEVEWKCARCHHVDHAAERAEAA